MKRLITICLAIMLFSSGYARAGTWTYENGPIFGIDGSNVVNGTYRYNLITGDFTNVTYPGEESSTIAWGISGNSVVGWYQDSSGVNHGFLYNGSSWTTLDCPGGTETEAYGISGNNIVGTYSGGGFLYNGSSWKTLNFMAYGISGNNIVGGYGNHGVLYNGTSLTTFDYPGAKTTCIYGINGTNLVGWYMNADNIGPHGFLYNGSSWTTLDYPGADFTWPCGISGNNIVGGYGDYGPGTRELGFIYTIPEPATLFLLGLGGLTLLRKR